MTSIVTDFKSIRRKLERQEQKAEFEAKEEAQRQSYAGLYGVMVPFEGVRTGGTSVPTHGICEHLPPYTPSQVNDLARKSLAHPEWPYTGTPHEWPKFKI